MVAIKRLMIFLSVLLLTSCVAKEKKETAVLGKDAVILIHSIENGYAKVSAHDGEKFEFLGLIEINNLNFANKLLYEADLSELNNGE